MASCQLYVLLHLYDILNYVHTKLSLSSSRSLSKGNYGRLQREFFLESRYLPFQEEIAIGRIERMHSIIDSLLLGCK